MPPADRLDRSLDRLLAGLAERLAASGDERVVVRIDDIGAAGADGLTVLCGLGLLVPAEPARSVVCDGCDRGCIMEVAFSAGKHDLPTQAFVICDRRNDIGRVPVETDSLRQWRFSLEQLAGVVANLFGSDREPRALGPSRAWDLGSLRVGKRIFEIRLDPAGGNGIPFDGLTVTLADLPDTLQGAAVALPSLIRFRNGQPVLDRAALRRALKGQYGDQRIAWEIKFEGDIVLINYVTGQPATIASPNFNSTNDNAFAVLFEHAGRKFSLQELRDAASDQSLASLHKLVEKLGFEGPLKKAFFRVSRDAIRFDRTATMGRLATLRIDPKADF